LREGGRGGRYIIMEWSMFEPNNFSLDRFITLSANYNVNSFKALESKRKRKKGLNKSIWKGKVKRREGRKEKGEKETAR